MATKKKIKVNIGVGDSTEATKRVAKALIDRYDNLSKWSDRTLKIFDKGENA